MKKILFLCAMLGLAGCSHRLVQTNAADYVLRSMSDYSHRGLQVRIVNNTPTDESIHFEEAMKDALARRGGYAMLDDTLTQADVIIDMSVYSRKKGKWWNFFVSWPGFLLFTPAWTGYGYGIDYQFNLSIHTADAKLLGVIDETCHLDVHHADFGRTWAANGMWPAVAAVTGLINGFYVLSYDNDVTPALYPAVYPTMAKTIAAKVIKCVNVDTPAEAEVKASDPTPASNAVETVVPSSAATRFVPPQTAARPMPVKTPPVARSSVFVQKEDMQTKISNLRQLKKDGKISEEEFNDRVLKLFEE